MTVTGLNLDVIFPCSMAPTAKTARAGMTTAERALCRAEVIASAVGWTGALKVASPRAASPSAVSLSAPTKGRHAATDPAE